MIRISNINVPHIRFTGSDGAWVKRRLGEVADIYDGTHQTPQYTTHGVMFLSVENIESLQSKKYISEKAFENDFKIFPQKGDVLMTRIGDIGTANVVESDIPIAYYVSLALFKLRSLDPYFLKQSISSKSVTKELWQRTLHIAFPKKINKNEIEKALISLPQSKSEQTKIGAYFRSLDNLIDLHQRKHDKLVTLKNAMLQKMFPQAGATAPEIRFKGFSGEWTGKKLGEVGAFNPKEALPEVFEYVDLESVVGTEMVSHRTETKKTAPSRAQRLARKGDLFFQTVRPYQKNNHIFSLPNTNYVFSTGYAQIRPYNDSSFLLGLMQRDDFVKEVLDNCTGTSYPAINSNVLAGISVLTPTPEEQEKIGNYFRTLDELISRHTTQLEKLKQIKSACLEKMFV